MEEKLRYLPSLILSIDRIDKLTGYIFPQEKLYLKRFRSEKRRKEFLAGRVSCRKALERLGLGSIPIGVGEDGRPIFPKGIVGSVSHSSGFCGCVVACGKTYKYVGLDIESVERMSEKVALKVCGTLEEYPLKSTVIFCAKEAFYKCLPVPFSNISVKLKENGWLKVYVNQLAIIGLWDFAPSLGLVLALLCG